MDKNNNNEKSNRFKRLRIILIVIISITTVGFAIKMIYDKIEENERLKIEHEQHELLREICLSTQELIPGIFVIKDDFVNFFLLKTDDKYIAIDAGLNTSNSREEISRLDIYTDDVVAVFLTHCHGDHIGALSLFSNATVYAGENILKTINKNLADRTMADGETKELAGISVQCVFTPGHTIDSVCYLVDNKYLFVGDTLSLHDNQVGLFISLFNDSDELQKDDIKKLAEMDVKYVFSSHYGFTDKAVFPYD
jgi:glyoxylase-like metal-dependent hydrolase (beta-lactamase superfamily II)